LNAAEAAGRRELQSNLSARNAEHRQSGHEDCKQDRDGQVRLSITYATMGSTIVRIIGDMACVKTIFETVHEMLVFERLVAAILARCPSVAICQYDVREFDGPSLLEAIKAHPDVSELGMVKFVT
jgi:hypothetical protein